MQLRLQRAQKVESNEGKHDVPSSSSPSSSSTLLRFTPFLPLPFPPTFPFFPSLFAPSSCTKLSACLPRLAHLPLQNTAIQRRTLEDVREAGELRLGEFAFFLAFYFVCSPSSLASSSRLALPLLTLRVLTVCRVVRVAGLEERRRVGSARSGGRSGGNDTPERVHARIAQSRRDGARVIFPSSASASAVSMSVSKSASASGIASASEERACGGWVASATKRKTYPMPIPIHLDIHPHPPSLGFDDTGNGLGLDPPTNGLVGAVLALLGLVLPGTALHRREGGAEGVDGGVSSA
ncbi:hypothetical protein B0H16DRAFT_1896773 [Mycena metata]|uniref:Uncharacterized protein n=1 Tax=Mycena metata TaxID=1033252 RepID=A0AAD7MJN8_9AGAR|nr:hypothetical protein B0H16DRAFT_1896773 [Mycena metata]